MKVTFLFFFFLFTGLFAKAQTNLDSLWTVWQDDNRQDTTRLQAIKTFIWDGYMYTQPDSAFYYAQLWYDFAKKSDLKNYMASGVFTQGNSFLMKGDYVNALMYMQKSLVVFQEIGAKGSIASNLNSIGVVYMDQGNNVKAIDYFERSLKLFEELGNNSRTAYCLNNIASIYEKQDEDATALTYYQRCLNYFEEAGHKKGIVFSLYNIGGIYSRQGDIAAALEYSQKSLLLAEEIEDKLEIATCLMSIGDIYNQSDNDKALDYFQSSLKVFEETGDKPNISKVLIRIGGIYYSQGEFLKGIVECNKGYLLALSIEGVLEQRDACKCLYNGYKALGNSNKALTYYEQMTVLSDSLKTRETSNKLQQMEFDKQVLADSIAQVEKERLVQKANDEQVNKKNKTIYLAVGGGLLFMILAGGFFSRSRYIKKSRDVISKEKDRSDKLLLNILPAEIAEELKSKGKADARDFDNVSILFTDFKSFTEASAKLSAQDLVSEINACFEVFDGIMCKYGIEKIKTIGDAYMAAGGLPVPSEDSLKNTVLAALEMQAFISKRKVEMDTIDKHSFQMRAGIHTGAVVAGIVGVKKFQYDIWGDAVNIASRMESNGQVGKVNISKQTFELIKDDEQFTFKKRGKIQAKGKGEIEMYFVELSSNG